MSEQEVFLATVSNMTPEEVFSRGLPRLAGCLSERVSILEGPSPVHLYSPACVAGVYLIRFCIRNLSHIPPASNPAVQSFCSV